MAQDIPDDSAPTAEGSSLPIQPPLARSDPTPDADTEEDASKDSDDTVETKTDTPAPPLPPTNPERDLDARANLASLATVDRQLHKGNPHKLTACFNERSHFFSPFADLSARYEPVPRGPLSLGLDAPSYRLVLRDESKGLMMLVDPQNTKTPLHLAPYTPPAPLTEAEQAQMPADMAAFNAAAKDVPRLDLAYDKLPEARMTFMSTIQSAIETKIAGETNAKNVDIVRGTIGFLDNANTIKSGLKSVIDTPASGLMTEGIKNVSGIFSLIDVLRHLADGRVAQSVVSLTGSVPLIGAFIQEGVAVGAEKLGFDVDPGPIQQTIEGLQGLVPPDTPQVCGTPPQINLKTLQASLEAAKDTQAQDNLAPDSLAPARKQETPHF